MSVNMVLSRGQTGLMIIPSMSQTPHMLTGRSLCVNKAGCRADRGSALRSLNMAGSQLLSVFTLLVLFLAEHVFGEVVNLGDSVQLTVKEECAGGDMELVRVRKTDPVPRTVAKLVRGVWEPAEDYKDRVHHVSTSSVNLTRANLNDNDGAFEFTCNSDGRVTIIQLTVVVPCDVRVSEGETARIPCYSSTEGIQGVHWEREGEPVLVQDRSSRQPEGRLSVSPDWVQTGDLSLTVKDAQLEDGGSYVCYTVDGKGEKTRGSPAAVTVTVQRSHPAPIGTPQQPTLTPADKQIGTGLIVSIIFNVLLLTAAVIFCALWRVSVRKARRAAGAAPGETIPLEGDGPISNGVTL